MKRRILTSAVAAAVVAALAIPALAASGASHRTVHFTETGVGAGINSKQVVYKVHDSILGNGAIVQTTTSSSATGGTDKSISYYGNASSVSRDTYKFGKPNAKGQLPFTGSGHDIRDTGKLKGAHITYTFTGTYDPKTKIVHFSLKGTES